MIAGPDLKSLFGAIPSPSAPEGHVFGTGAIILPPFRAVSEQTPYQRQKKRILDPKSYFSIPEYGWEQSHRQIHGPVKVKELARSSVGVGPRLEGRLSKDFSSVDRLIEATFNTFVFSALESSVARYESCKKGMAPWSRLVENSLAGICIDQDDKIAFANKIFAEIHGY